MTFPTLNATSSPPQFPTYEALFSVLLASKPVPACLYSPSASSFASPFPLPAGSSFLPFAFSVSSLRSCTLPQSLPLRSHQRHRSPRPLQPRVVLFCLPVGGQESNRPLPG